MIGIPSRIPKLSLNFATKPLLDRIGNFIIASLPLNEYLHLRLESENINVYFFPLILSYLSVTPPAKQEF